MFPSHDLINQNGKLNDPQILKILVDNRHKLRDRFNAKVTIFTDKGEQLLSMSVFGILPEEIQIAYDVYPVGTKVDPTDIPQLPNWLADSIRTRYGINQEKATGYTIHYQVLSKQSITIGGIGIEPNFA